MFEDLIEIKNCSCGRDHSLVTKEYIVERGAIARLPELLKKTGTDKSPLCVYDMNTKKAAGERVRDVLGDAEEVVFECAPGELVHSDESTIEPLTEMFKSGKYSVGIAVGSGVITDAVRYAAFLADVPFISVPTAASVDGFVSGSCAVTLNGSKASRPARAPIAVVADLDVIAAAPEFLAASGVGDMVSKYLAIVEWKLGKYMCDEYYCDKIAQCTLDATDSIMQNVEGIAKRDINAYSKLIEGLLLSGIAMQLATITRPASSFEHHFSHYPETVPGTGVDHTSLHGEKVGVGTLIATRNYPAFIDALEKIADGAENKFTTQRAVSYFTDKPQSVQEFVAQENTPTVTQALKRDLLIKNMDIIKKTAAELPDEHKILSYLQTVGAKTTYADLNLDRETAHRVFSTCCYIRNRFTTLRIMQDYQIFDFDTLQI